MTLPEVKLWQVLRIRPQGLRFRRQHPIGPFIVDFYCPVARLAIEVDGATHGTESFRAGDVARDQLIGERAVRTLRVPAADILRDVETVVRLIVAECEARSVRGSD